MTWRTAVHAALFLIVAATAPACAKQRGHDAAGESEQESFGRLTVEQLEAKMAAAKAGQLKLAIYDNNQRDVWQKGHIPGARWVKFDAVQAGDLPADKDTELVFYCANEH